MPDFRAFCGLQTDEPREIVLSADESHHLVVVNRARRGDPVIAFDGQGREWTCQLTVDRKQAAILTPNTSRRAPVRTHAITLAQALPKGSSMDSIVRKATEIGATTIIPLETERTQVHLDADRSDKKIDKWRLAALEAAKQCGNPFLPDIRPVETFQDFLARSDEYDLKLIASLQPEAQRLRSVLERYHTDHHRDPKSILCVVGPEGDFAPSEMEQSKKFGFIPITLGPLVLRCETAAIYALSIVFYELSSRPV
jgi:16S rRNA (uracil1498-N3)-methyltransferase